MLSEIDLETRAIDLNVGQLQDVIRQTVREMLGERKLQKKVEEETEHCNRTYVQGMKAIALEMGVSLPTANKYKDEGILDGAIEQMGKGRRITADVEKLHEIMRKLCGKELQQ